MGTEVTVTCDGCGKEIKPDSERVLVMVQEMDTGKGITSAPVNCDFHPDCLPDSIKDEMGYEHGSLIGTMLPGAEEPISAPEAQSV